MNRNRFRTSFRHTLAVTTLSVLAAGSPLMSFQAYATPSFSHTAEEWATLQDNKIEYGELAGLVHEYNTTVYNNRIKFADFKKDYGTTKDDVAQAYRDLASELYQDIDYPDTGDVTYGSSMAVAINARANADSYEKQADENLEDSTIINYGYEQAEANLVSVAQANMISYYQDQLTIQQANLSKEQAQVSYDAAVSQQNVGTATQITVLNAKETLQSSDQTIQTAETSLATVHQKLCVMLGWKYNDQPEIAELPTLDLNRITAMNPAVDVAKALENNYTLKINKRKLENANSESQRDSLTKTIANNEANIGSSLTTAYQNVIASQTAYQLAQTDYQLAQQNMAIAEQNHSQGTISQVEYRNQQITTQLKEIAVKSAELSLFQTMETYDWNVNGLASASAV